MFYINTLCHGGAERVIVNLASQFNRNGDSVVLVTSFKDENEYSVDTSIKRVYLKEERISGFLKKNGVLIWNLRKVIKEETPDIVVSFMAEPNFRNLISTIGIRTKKIISVRNDPYHEYPNLLYRLLAKTLFLCADGVVFQTEDARQWFSKKIRKKSVIIYNQVDERFFEASYEGEQKDIVTVGRLCEQKNQKLLIEAFAEISNEISDDLYIYGDGTLKEDLQQLIDSLNLSNRVFLPGVISNVSEVIKTAKIFVMTSDYEGMPNSLMEAMALGLPCISTDCPCGGPRAVFGGYEKGLVSVGNRVELAQCMSEYVKDKKLRSESAQMMKKAAEQFKPNVVFRQWKKFLYEEK